MTNLRFLFFFVVILLIYVVAPSREFFTWPVARLSYGEMVTPLSSRPVSLSSKPQLANLAKVDDQPSELLFVGDVMLARNVEVLMAKHGESYPYQGIDFAQLAIDPYVFGNFEAVVPELHQPTEMFKLNFSVAAKFLAAAKTAGFDSFSLANNHSHDFAAAGLENTRRELLANDINYFGNPETLNRDSVSFVKVNNQIVAVIGLQAIERPLDTESLQNVFAYANKRSDWQIVYVHWGIEYSPTHSKLQRKLAKQLVDAGADVIIGHHPHVVQDIEMVDGVPVFYSLGNYIFDQYFSTPVQEGLLLQLGFLGEPYIRLLPVSSVGTLSQPHLMSEANSKRFLGVLAKRSDAELQANIKNSLIPLNIRVATSSKMAMMKL